MTRSYKTQHKGNVMLESIWQFLSVNQFASGGLVVVLSSSVAWVLRGFPFLVWKVLYRILFYHCEIDNNDESYAAFAEWIAQKVKDSRYVTVITNWSSLGQGFEDRNENGIHYIPAPGSHFFWDSFPLFVRRERQESSATASDDFTSLKNKEKFVIVTLFWWKNKIHNLLQTVCQQDKINEIAVYTNDLWCWHKIRDIHCRPLSSVVLANNIADDLKSDMAWFLDSRQWYADRAIPYRRGYLLYGPPGNGKTSVAHALASEFRMRIYILNLSDKMLNDESLSHLMHKVSPKSIILLEDVDSIFKGRESEEKGISFSGLLNVLCGVASSDGKIIFMTTNHKEKLDVALIRPGRADKHIFIDNATPDQIERLFTLFFPQSGLAQQAALSLADKSLSMADVQAHFIENWNNADLAADLSQVTRRTESQQKNEL